ncbi:YebG family protein [Teredinibacter sp. KSP-S5-2]|uniref:YebG family protein n=1 Tax=Teredinibacter sp. KSP-S5-2 TaxID=3034506 RepID=UPI0029352EC0|nr:YebG family protein [Teredinibacter sp. KSP-S5-2]WNO09205.1 YebG family protein [Teredinibacter sp. KSP-S5-2]
MTIEVVYRVKKPNGELAGEYMDKKLADAHDQKLDCIYTIAELIQENCKELNEDLSEQVAECLVDNRDLLVSSLKKVKSIPGESTSSKEAESSVTPLKQASAS